MPEIVPGPWIAAARWSGGLDLRPILARLGGAAAFLGATEAELRAAGLAPRRAQQALETPPQPCADRWIHLADPRYPPALLDLSRPPPVIWLRGCAELLREPGIAVVGTRRCTRYGRRTARRLGSAITREGGVLVSGAARGIDEAAHRGALDGGRTVAVLGSGLASRRDPRKHALIQAIVDAGGLVLSELPPSDPAARWTFPRRNRLIAALSLGTVVVEAPRRSGALITAEHAAELGRPLFAVPGPVDAPASAGSLALIEAGVSCLTSPAPVLSLLDRGGIGSPAAQLRRALAQPGHPAELARRSGLGLSRVLLLLAELELTQVVQRLPDSRYALR